MNPPLLGCIADDFTGATDLANNLVRSGMRCVQTIGVPGTGAVLPEVDAVVVALKSRTIAPADAVTQSLAAARWLKNLRVEQLYFKYCSTFDSTPQGNIGPVTDALLDELGSRFTIACPAFPQAQRTIFKGHLFVGDLLLSDSGMKDHPLTPMTDANLVRVLQQQTQRRVGLVDHSVIARGADAIAQRFRELQAQGVGIAVLDTLSDADLLVIGRALAGMPLVTAGSGIAIGLPQNWNANKQLSASAVADKLPPLSGRRAIVSGSCSLATNAQVEQFKKSGGKSFCVDPLALARGDDVAGLAAQWAQPLLAGGPVLIYATAEPQAVKAVQEKLGAAQASALVEKALADVASRLLDLGVRQLVVAGGETSGAVVNALGITQLVIGPQISPGVPWTFAQGGKAPIHLALKSGNFGGVDFFRDAFGKLQ